MTEENIRETQRPQLTDEWRKANSHVLRAIALQKESFLAREGEWPTVVYVPLDVLTAVGGLAVSELSGKLVVRQLKVILHDGDAIFCRRETEQTKKTKTLSGINRLLVGRNEEHAMGMISKALNPMRREALLREGNDDK